MNEQYRYLIRRNLLQIETAKAESCMNIGLDPGR